MKKKNNRRGSSKNAVAPKEVTKQAVMKAIAGARNKPASVKDVLKALGVNDLLNKKRVTELYKRVKQEHKELFFKDTQDFTPFFNDEEVLTGKIDHVSPQFAFIITEGKVRDVWVNSKDLSGAMHDDIVTFVVTKEAGNSRRPEGKVLSVVKRGRDEVPGRLIIGSKYARVMPDIRKMYVDIDVTDTDLAGANNNDKVLVKITRRAKRGTVLEGEITRVLGPAGDHFTEMHAIMAEFNLPFEFPGEVEEESQKIPVDITEAEIKGRRDFRETTTFTIDPADAKDFDDAISFRILENGHMEIGVHIADVTHYLKPGSELDKEAYERATSVYLVDRCIPMLPEKLSNNLCSLMPHVDRLAYAAVFEMDEAGKIHKEWFGKTIIHSDRRFSYEQAQEVLTTGEGDFAQELNALNKLAYVLRDQRFKKGSIGFETVEVKFDLDEKGKPLGLKPKIRQDAHKLIEDFMLLANKRVAEFVFNIQKNPPKTMVYRTHGLPDPEKLGTLTAFAEHFGHTVHLEDTERIAGALNRLITAIEGKPEQNVLQNLAIRSMAKAVYTTESEGHFGLAFPHYTHFTSPIRRYPDVMVHRLLTMYLDGAASANEDEYEERCRHSSDREKRAADAERASVKYKQAEYMAQFGDRPFNALVTGVTEWGVFAEIPETACEGLIRYNDIPGDYFEPDSKGYKAVGRRTGQIITLGDKLTVKVKKANLDTRTIDLLIESFEHNA